MLKEQIEKDLILALKERNADLTAVLRLLKANLQKAQIEKGQELTDTDIESLIKSQIKRHKESAESFKSGGREVQAQAELEQAQALSKYLPEPMSEEEIRAKIATLLAQNAWSTKDFGIAMKTVKESLGNTADGALVATILKELLK